MSPCIIVALFFRVTYILTPPWLCGRYTNASIKMGNSVLSGELWLFFCRVGIGVRGQPLTSMKEKPLHLYSITALYRDESKTARVQVSIKPVISVFTAAGKQISQMRVSVLDSVSDYWVNPPPPWVMELSTSTKNKFNKLRYYHWEHNIVVLPFTEWLPKQLCNRKPFPENDQTNS